MTSKTEGAVNALRQASPRRVLIVCIAGTIDAVALFGLSGCQPAPRLEADTLRAMSDVADTAASIEFRKVGPDGAPLDESITPGALDMAETVRRAVTTDPGLQAALARVRIAAAEADQARLLPNPVVFVVVRWGAGTPQVEASFVQDFVQALQIPTRASAADNRLRAAAAGAISTALDVASDARRAYTEAQAASALVPALEQRLAAVDHMASIANDRAAVGEGAAADAATLEAQRISLQVDIARARLAEREARIRLARTVGQPSAPGDWRLEPWSMPSGDLGPESAWIETALRHRPELQAIDWRLQALGDDKVLAHLLPWDEEEALLPLPNPWEPTSVGADFQKQDGSAIGPSIATPLPIFDSGQARRARIVAEIQEARHERTGLRRRAVEEVRVAYQTMLAGEANLRLIRDELIPLQQRRRALAEDSYRLGESEALALFAAEQDLQAAQAQAIETGLLAQRAYIELQRSVGGAAIAASIQRAQLAPSADTSPASSKGS